MSVETGTHLFEVTNRDLDGLPDARGESVWAMLAADHGIEVAAVRVILGYQVQTNLAEAEAEDAAQRALRIAHAAIGPAGNRVQRRLVNLHLFLFRNGGKMLDNQVGRDAPEVKSLAA